MTDRELMQMALDALEEYVGVVVSVNDPNDWTPKVADAGEPARKAIEALRARLAEPEQEPVACDCDSPAWCKQYKKCHRAMLGFEPYVAPPQREWQGLTDEEVRDLWSWAMTAEAERTANTQQHAFARAIEAKLKEKNT